MIKAIILDVDGVIIGDKNGQNYPDPHPLVIKTLKSIKNSGITVCLCTAKPQFSISKIVTDANLDNVHITDGGGIIADLLNKWVVKENYIPGKVASAVVSKSLESGFYSEVYTADHYYVQKSQVCQTTVKHSQVLQCDPIIADSLVDISLANKVTKVMSVAQTKDDRPAIEASLSELSSIIDLTWGVHPSILPLQFAIITNKGISKKAGVLEVAKTFGISTSDMLGVGDGKGDWNFIEVCGYAAAMGNGDDELKVKVATKPKGNYFIAPDVDSNGILDVFKYFGIN